MEVDLSQPALRPPSGSQSLVCQHSLPRGAGDAERHLFTFRNDGVAAEFAQLNANNTWNPASPRAKLASWLRWAFLIAILLFGLYNMIKDALR